MLLRLLPPVLAALPVLIGSPAALGQDSDERIAKIIARKLIVDFLEANESLAFKSDRADATATALEPARSVELGLENFNAGFGTASGTLIVDAPFRVEATLKRGGDQDQEPDEEPDAEPDEGPDEGQRASAIVDLRLTIDSSAEIQEVGGVVKIRAKAEGLKCEVTDLRELEPADLPGAKGLVEDTFRENEEQLRRTINEWLDKNLFEADPDNPPGRTAR